MGREADDILDTSPEIIDKKNEEHLKDPKFDNQNLFMSDEEGNGG